jgi:aminoglycoside phosphotransferase (APT) family kinase protein
MCRRAFGPAVSIVSARELGGGTFNSTFLITLDDQQAILRVAPPSSAELAWHEQWLMRREQQIKPFFAALGSLMPRTILADFTHQLLDRDYVFQTFITGDRWDEVADTLSADEQLRLWGQFGSITKTIHSTRGTRFGGPYPEPEFSSWSEAIEDRLERAIQAMIDVELDTSDMLAVLDFARAHTAVLDAIEQPRLMHGDLWLFNILIDRSADGPSIVGVLDADRAWWGDPQADWTMFVLSKAAAPETDHLHSRFWQSYGARDQTPEAEFRQAIYEALHIGTALVWATHHDDKETLQRGADDLRAVITLLPTLPL